MPGPEKLAYEVLCPCGRWHRIAEFRRHRASWNAVGYGWIIDCIAPCGRVFRTHGADPAYGVDALHLEDHFRVKRLTADAIASVACPRCRAILAQNPEKYWDAWRWESGRGKEIHARMGVPGAWPPAVCGAQDIEYPEEAPPPITMRNLADFFLGGGEYIEFEVVVDEDGREVLVEKPPRYERKLGGE